jgi:heme-degrading monooxygenase HmoA
MTAIGFAELPDPPYFAVIFSSQRTPGDAGYAQMADRMVELAAEQQGYLGIESARDEVGFGITVSYWNSLEAIRNWRAQAEHRIAQEYGMKQWYLHYEIRIAHVTRAYRKHR